MPSAQQVHKQAYAMDLKEVIKALSAFDTGLSSEEAKRRLWHFGKNVLPEQERESCFKLFIDQFNNALIWLLVFATVLSLILGQAVEAAAMAVIILITAVLGFIQEYHASKAIEALKKAQARTARVLRDGQVTNIASSEVVPGDIMLIEEGDILAADARLTEVAFLRIDEASLTGESLPSTKVTRPFKLGTSLADQEDMAFAGTVVVYGKGKGIVTSTGIHTQLGYIARNLKEHEDVKTPLQIRFTQMARQIGVVAMVLIAAVFVIGVLHGFSVSMMLITALSLTAATIPNALPVIVAVGLAFGAKSLAKRRLLVKRLPAAESLGSVTMICTDKTGTLTKNQMTVTRVFADGEVVTVTGSGYSPKGEFLLGQQKVDHKRWGLLCRIGSLCNNARLVERDSRFEVVGDPTEGALIVLGRKAGFDELAEKDRLKGRVEIPFDSDRKRMAVVCSDRSGSTAYVKGAPESLLPLCSKYCDNGKVIALTKKKRAEITAMNERFAGEALRVLALAYRTIPPSIKKDDWSIEEVERDLVFVGLAGMMDPPREGVSHAVQKCARAGIKVMIITGDNAVTAKAVAESIGLFKQGDIILTGEELDQLSDEALAKRICSVRIIARALPIQKSRVVVALKRNGHIVAMTGDGVNDSPALKDADIGIAMGITGTDVAREVAKAVLVDDNFATIVNGIEEGRTIYDKIIKSARYLLSCNVGEITVVLAAVSVGMPVPMLPLQILLMNVLTDNVPALGLGLESPEESVMDRPPRDPGSPPITPTLFASILLFGVIMGIATLIVFSEHLKEGLPHARTIAFTTLVMVEMFAVQSSRSLSFSWRKLNPFSNMWLSGAVLLSILLQLLVIYWHPMNRVFGTTPLSATDWVWVLGVSAMGFVLMEIGKYVLPGFQKIGV